MSYSYVLHFSLITGITAQDLRANTFHDFTQTRTVIQNERQTEKGQLHGKIHQREEKIVIHSLVFSLVNFAMKLTFLGLFFILYYLKLSAGRGYCTINSFTIIFTTQTLERL